MSTKVIIPCRFSYANVWEPKSIDGGAAKYSASLIIPKKDKKTLTLIKQAIEEAKDAGKEKWGGKIPANLKLPLRDGDEERPDNEAYQDSYFLNANSNSAPSVVDNRVQAIMDRDEFYSGCYGKASVTFYAFNSNGNRGIAAGLGNIQKLRDGESLGGNRARAEDEFDVEDDEDDDVLS